MNTISQRTAPSSGFTLIEVLLVIAILAILASVVIVAINPARQLASSRNAERWSDVYAILNALHQYALDNEGSFPESIEVTGKNICRTGSNSCDGLADLSELTDEQRYLTEIPIDPICTLSNTTCDDNNAMYSVEMTEFGRVRVSADDSELEEVISVIR